MKKRDKKIEGQGVIVSREAMKRSSDELEGIVVKDVNLEVVSEVIDACVLEKAVTESSVNKDDEDGMNSKDGKGNTWALVSPDKVGRSQSKTLQRDAGVVQISASKFSVLSLDMEEGEILAVQTNEDEEEDHVEAEVNILVEGDLMGDEILEQSMKSNDKAIMQKGVKRGQKARAQEYPKSKRSSRRNL